jgi:hypothetical protein
MTEIQPHGSQQHSVDASPLVEHLIPSMIPMTMVSDNRVPKAIQVPADLMPPAVLWPNLQQGKPRSFKTRSWPGDLVVPKASKMGDGRLERMFA